MGKQRNLVDMEKNMEQTASENQRYPERGGGEKPNPKAALVLTAFWFQFLPSFPKKLG